MEVCLPISERQLSNNLSGRSWPTMSALLDLSQRQQLRNVTIIVIFRSLALNSPIHLSILTGQ